VEENAVVLTGLVQEIKAPYTSPAGIVHEEWVLEHRSRQTVAGKAREVKAQVIIKVTGAELNARSKGIAVGHRIRVQGLLAQANYQHTQQLLIHAQLIEIIE
jgi:primosomal replication protein N